MMKKKIISQLVLLGLTIGNLGAQCFKETSPGVISIEAEDFISQEKTSKREWFVIGNGATTPRPDPDGSHVTGASGGKYIEVLPDTRVVGHSGPGPEDPIIRGENFSDRAGELAVLNYKVNFASAGKYFVWARLYSSGPEDNSVHVGINNTWPASGERMQWCEGRRSWTWESKQRTREEHCGIARQIFINVPSAGVHTFQISMREDGVELDKIVLSKQYTKPTGQGPVARRDQNCGGNTNNCNLPNVTNNSTIAVVADGNSPDPDDIGGTAVSLAMARAFGSAGDVAYYAHSCDLKPFQGSNQTITPALELERQQLMQTSAQGTASRWGGFGNMEIYNCRTQERAAINKLRDLINLATGTKPIAIILAGEPDVVYDAVAAAQAGKRRWVTIISHHVANEESADTPGKNISDLRNDFPTVQVTRIPDQNTLLQTPIADWDWAKNHPDSRIKWLWDQGKIAEQDPAVRFQRGKFDCSDAGMMYYQLTGDENPDVPKIKKLLTCYIDGLDPNENVAPIVSITSPEDNAVFELGQVISLKASASDPDGNLDKVNFKINDAFYRTDNERPFENTFTPTEAGTYKIAVRAFDRENLQTEVFVTITVVAPNEPPVASFTTPSVNTIEEGYESLVFTVEASDPNGDQITVLLKIDGQDIRSESVAPYEWGHNGSPNSAETLGMTEGEHTIEAIVTDAQGESVTISKTITVTPRVITSTDKASDAHQLLVFPNPSGSGVFHLSVASDFEVLSLSGSSVMEGKGKVVDLSSFPKGTYVLRAGLQMIKLIH